MIKLIDPDTGDTMEVPEDKIVRHMEQGLQDFNDTQDECERLSWEREERMAWDSFVVAILKNGSYHTEKMVVEGADFFIEERKKRFGK